MTPSFSDLTYFYEAANVLNLSQAAKKLGVTQPSLSIAINRLEKTLDTPLFIRHRQGVTLTQSGERLKDHVKDLLLKWKSTQSSIQSLSDNVNGSVSIGCHAALAPHLSQVTFELLQKHPLLEIKFRHDASVRMTESVIDGTLDIAIVYDPIKHPDLIMRKVQDIELTFWQSSRCTTNHEIIIGDPQIPQMHKLIKEIEKLQPVARICTVGQYEMTANLVSCGAGLGILPSCVVGKQYSDKVTRVEHAPSILCEMYLIYRSENRDMRAREVVLNALKSLIP